MREYLTNSLISIGGLRNEQTDKRCMIDIEAYWADQLSEHERNVVLLGLTNALILSITLLIMPVSQRSICSKELGNPFALSLSERSVSCVVCLCVIMGVMCLSDTLTLLVFLDKAMVPWR